MFVLCVVSLVEVGVDIVEDGMFCVCDVCVWGVECVVCFVVRDVESVYA